MVGAPKIDDTDMQEQLEDIIASLSVCLRALLNLTRQGPVLNLVRGGNGIMTTATEIPTSEAQVCYNAYVVENFEGADRAEKSHWTKVGAAFAHQDGKGFNVELATIPASGKLMVRAQQPRG